MTNFVIHFGEDGTNTVLHSTAIMPRNGKVVPINESDKELIQSFNPNHLKLDNGKIVKGNGEFKKTPKASTINWELLAVSIFSAVCGAMLVASYGF